MKYEECDECFLLNDYKNLESKIKDLESKIDYFKEILREIEELPKSPFFNDFDLQMKIERMRLIAQKAIKEKW
tara:strand:- start:980 stop:1198 length:219 start_codon:yes stop_codon:yes gene_type:complete